MSIYDLKVKTRKGEDFDLSSLKGKVSLVVNTATGCGFTPQYEAIEKLYDVSAVSLPANDATEISARNLGEGVIAEVKQERLAEEARRRTMNQIAIMAEMF